MAQDLADLLESLNAHRFDDALGEAEEALESHRWIDSIPDAWDGPEAAAATLAAEEVHIVAIMTMRGDAARHCRPAREAEEFLKEAIARPSKARWLQSGTYESWIARARHGLSEVLRLNGDLEGARILAEEALAWFLGSNRMPDAAGAQLTLAWIAETNERPGEAADRLSEALGWWGQTPRPSDEALDGRWSEVALAAAALGQTFLNAGDNREATRLLGAAGAFYASAKDQAMEATCTLMLGIAQLRGDAYPEAIRSLRAALERRTVLNPEQIGRCHLELGIALRLFGRLTEAEVEAAAAVAALGRGRLAADALTNLARVLTLLERDAEAQAAYLAAIDAAEATEDPHDIATTHTGYGEYLVARSRAHESLPHVFKARVANRLLGDSDGVADCDLALSTAYEAIGLHATARTLLNQAIATYRQLGSRIGLGNALVERGVRAMRAGKRSTAERSFRSARRQYRGHPYGLALATDWLGLLGLRFGRPDARKHLLDAVEQWEALGLLDTADARLEQLLRASRKSDVPVAEQVFDDVQAWVGRLPHRRAAALVALESARRAVGKGDPVAARIQSTEAMRRYRRLGDAAGLAEAEQVLAKILPVVDRALLLRGAVRRLERSRRTKRSEFEQFRDSARWRELYDDALRAAVSADRYEDALEVAAATMGRVQDDQWQLSEQDAANETLAMIPDCLTAAGRTRWSELTDRRLDALAVFTRAIADESNGDTPPVRIETAERELILAQDEWWKFYESARARIARRRRGLSQRAIRLAALRAAVAERHVAMVVVLWRPNLRLALVLRPGDAAPVAHRFDEPREGPRLDERIEDLVRAWRDRALEGEWSVLDDRIWQTRLETLRSLLWRPIREIVGSLPVRLTPDENLASVPWGWLDRSSAGSLRVAPAPGLLLTRVRSHKPTATGRSLLAIGDDADGRYLGVRNVLDVARGWPRGTARIVSGADTVSTLLGDSGTYDAVLLVAHASPGGDPERIGIVLSERVRASRAAVSRTVSVFELLRLGIRARTVLLLGCANLSPAAGPELLSVASAVQAATRADAVLATHTRVSDLGVSLVWMEMRDALARGEPLEAALASALERVSLGTASSKLDAYLDHVSRTRSPRADKASHVPHRNGDQDPQPFRTWAAEVLRSRTDDESGEGSLLPLLDQAAWVVVGP
jgi:tetratricopeptide (TPR) repeat protein